MGKTLFTVIFVLNYVHCVPWLSRREQYCFRDTYRPTAGQLHCKKCSCHRLHEQNKVAYNGHPFLHITVSDNANSMLLLQEKFVPTSPSWKHTRSFVTFTQCPMVSICVPTFVEIWPKMKK